ncbi:MAG: tetratricopeptide repeat protein [Acidobacteriia bacterium]|nr:tetratricopeptide repeat protein [Terriglobia bacterium]
MLLAAVIGFVTLLAYVRTFRFEFVYDDTVLILKNPAVLSSGHFWNYFSSDAVSGFAAPMAHIYYRPLLLSWFRMNFLLFGLQPAGWHVTAVLLHVLATVLVYAVGRAVRLSPSGTAMAALVFGLHPLHVETAAWISGAADSLYAVFALSSFLLFLRWFHGGRKASLAGALVLFAAGTLCKESAIVFPAIVFAYGWIDACPGASPIMSNIAGRLRASLRASAGYVLVGIGYFGLRLWSLGQVGGHVTSLGWGTVVFTWPKILCFHLWHLVYPVGLSEAYSIRYVSRPAEPGFYLPLLALLVCGLALYAWQRKSDTKLVRLACVWLLLPLLPTLDLNAFGIGEFVHDRFLYLSVLSMALLMGLAVEKLQGETMSGQFPLRGSAVCVAVGSVLLALTVGQTGIWKDDLSLFTRAYQYSPHSRSASINLASALASHGRFSEAKAIYLRSLQDWPMEWTTIYNYGYLCYQQGDLAEAEKYLLRAIQIYPNNDMEHFFLGLTWNKMGQREKAMESLQKAIEISPKKEGYHFALGVLMRAAGNEMGACMAFRQELALVPNSAEAAAQYRRCIQ